MPVTQGVGAFSVGRDCTIVVIGPFGRRVDLPNVTGFQSMQMVASIDIDRLDGTQMFSDLPKGWSGSFDLERGSPGVDDLFDQIEKAWRDTGTYIASTLYQYVTEPDGSTSTYQFSSVALKLDDAGSWKGDASVKQRISFRADRRRKV